MKKYSEVFKREVLRDYFVLMTDGSVEVDGAIAETTRDLCDEHEISRFSLYKWRDEIDMTKDKGVTKSKKKSKKSPEKKEKVQDEVTFDDFTFDPETENKLIVRSEIRFYAFLASLFGIKGYGTMKLTQLKLRLGLRLIKESGLVNTKTK